MNERDEHIGCTFDAYCKRTLRNESVNAHRELKRLGQREVTFSVLDMEVEITDGALVRALTALSPQRRDIVLLAYLLEMTDAEIARRLALNRSTVQYRRTSTLAKLQKLMEEYNHESTSL